MTLTIKNNYRVKVSKNPLIYIGREADWFVFSKPNEPKKPWSYYLESDLHLIEEV